MSNPSRSHSGGPQPFHTNTRPTRLLQIFGATVFFPCCIAARMFSVPDAPYPHRWSYPYLKYPTYHGTLFQMPWGSTNGPNGHQSGPRSDENQHSEGSSRLAGAVRLIEACTRRTRSFGRLGRLGHVPLPLVLSLLAVLMVLLELFPTICDNSSQKS